MTLNHVFRVRISVDPQTLRVYNKCFSFKFKVNGNSWRTGVEIMDFDFLPKVLFHCYFEKSLLVQGSSTLILSVGDMGSNPIHWSKYYHAAQLVDAPSRAR